MIDIKFKQLHPNAKLPTLSTEYAGAWDVYAADIKKIRNDWWEIDLGFSLEFPEGYRLMLQPRSSITKTDLIQQNSPGIGDSDYRGSYKFIFKKIPSDTNHITGALSYRNFPFRIGDWNVYWVEYPKGNLNIAWTQSEGDPETEANILMTNPDAFWNDVLDMPADKIIKQASLIAKKYNIKFDDGHIS